MIMERLSGFRKKMWLMLAVLSSGVAVAQTDADLLRFSMLNPIGTARFNAMGGAFGALGANFSSLSTNPAGIGLYTRHEISLTGGFVSVKAGADYYGERNYMDVFEGIVPEGGGVAVLYDNSRSKGLKRLQLGFGANRLKDFNSGLYSSGINTQSSYMEYVAASSYGYDFATEYGQGIAHVGNLAYQTGLMNYKDETSLEYVPFLGPGLLQKRTLQESGNISDLAFSFGGNWSDMIYFGATVGVPLVDYYQKSVFQESNTGLPLPHNFQSYSVEQITKMEGTGLNLKLGLIFKPVNFFRIGVAFHTPTYYWMKEETQVSMNTNMKYVLSDNSVLPNSASYRYRDEYDMISPAKGILSLGFIIKNFASVSVEGELIDYSNMKLSVDQIDYQNQIRDVVKENYRLSGVVRAGTEWKVGIVSLRAGYIWQSCPYSSELMRSYWSDHTATAGLGLALGRWNLDFGFMADLSKRRDDFYYIVDQNNNPLVDPARVNFAKYVYTLTLGYRF